MITLKKIKIITLSIALFLFLFVVIVGFTYSWKSGLILTLSEFFLLLKLGSHLEREKSVEISKTTRNIFSILFLCTFFWGASYFPKVTNETKNKLVEETTKETTKKLKPIVTLNISELKEFQKTWADSVVKSWGGDFIVSNKLSLPDTIYFELSKKATQSFNSNKSQSLPMYLFSYKNSLKNKFGTQYSEIETVIDFMPNKELLKNNNPNDWTHPIAKNSGLKIYGGNEYSKEFIGTLQCKYKDESDGNTYYVLYKDNGNETRIVDYQFDNCWVKQKDADSRIGIGIQKCY